MEVVPSRSYISRKTVDLIKAIAPADIDRGAVTRYAKRRSLVLPKMMRKVARFIQSRFGELRISEVRYEDLLTEAGKHYPNTLKGL